MINTIKGNNISDLSKNDEIIAAKKENNNSYDVPAKFIYKPFIARHLLKNHELIDIRPDKEDPARTVFVFRDSLKLRDDMLAILKERNDKTGEDKVFNHDNDYIGETKIIFKPYIARRLNHNHKIVDIKPDKNNPKRTIFVFADSLELRDDMQRILRNRRDNNNDDSEE